MMKVLSKSSEFEEDFEQYSAEQQQAREQAKQQRQRQKREQAEQMAAQSLKTVYLKIAAMIHPDREQDETKKKKKLSCSNKQVWPTKSKICFIYLNSSYSLNRIRG